MHRHNEDSIRSLVVAVEQQHPRPRAEDESSQCPPSPQFRACEGKGFKHPQRADDPTPGVSRKIEPLPGLIHIPLRLRGDDYLCHSAQLVERNTFPTLGLGEPLLSPPPSAGNRVENLRYATGIRIRFVQGSREEGPSQGSLLHMGPLRKPRELVGVTFVQGHVDPLGVSGHEPSIAQIYTPCANWDQYPSEAPA